MLGLFAYLASGGIHSEEALVNMEALVGLMEPERKP